MRTKHPVIQIAIMVVAATAVAVIANGFAGNTRRLMLPGYYPNALKVPAPAPAQNPSPPAPLPVERGEGGQQPDEGPPPTAATTTVTPIVPPKNIDPQQTAAAGAPGVPTPAPAKSTPAPAPATPAPDPLARFQPDPDKAYLEIGGDDVALLHSRGVLFLDARRTSVFEEGHIAGARSYSVWEADIDEKVNALFNERSDPRDQNLPIVIYCSGGACEDSHMLAQKLWGVQFNNVYVYKDGYPDWLARGGAVKKGSAP